MTPVLALRDPQAGAAFLVARLGFTAEPSDPFSLHYGAQRLRLVAAGAPVPGLIELPFDHLAMRVADPDATQAELQARGAVLHPGFTPNGPREIPEFGAYGVRFVFFEGPEGAPFEFLARHQVPLPDGRAGHEHYGLRCAHLPDMVARLVAMGAVPVEEHRLNGPAGTVQVAFLRLGDAVFELFDEAGPSSAGWIGFLA